jgi:hypothetical protein
MDSTLRQLRKSETSDVAETVKRRKADRAEQAKDRPYVVRLMNMRASGISERLALIVEACHRVEQLSESIRLSSDSESKVQRAECAKTLKDLNAYLSGYKWHPTLTAYTEEHFYFHVRFSFHAANHEEATENLAVEWLMRHTAEIHRIRRCRRPQCRKWFSAVTDHQKYCGENCRKRDAQQGPEFKRKRAEYMRDKYRPLQKKLDVQNLAPAKRLAKGKSK